ncbi:MAG: flagellar export protein FliJ [Phycisphaerales bacterium]
MARFVFRMQRLLEQRQREEDERTRAVAELDRQRVDLEAKIRAAQGAIDGAKRDLRDALAGQTRGGAGAVLDVRSARLQAGATIQQVMRTQQLAIALAGVHQRLNTARAALLEAATKRKAVELLRAKQYDRWLLEQNRRESAAMDEMGVGQWRRRERTVESTR